MCSIIVKKKKEKKKRIVLIKELIRVFLKGCCSPAKLSLVYSIFRGKRCGSGLHNGRDLRHQRVQIAGSLRENHSVALAAHRAIHCDIL